jgi:hypothetical protein
MSRSITAAIDTALSEKNVPLLIFTELDFQSGISRITNASYSFDWNGHTWMGLGEMGTIQQVTEGAELQMYGISLKISGIDPVMMSTALAEQYQGRSVKVWLAPLTQSYQVIADPVLIFSGRMDTLAIEIGEQAAITLTAESRLVDWERPRTRRFNQDDQASEYPSDKGFEYIYAMVDKVLNWGRA